MPPPYPRNKVIPPCKEHYSQRTGQTPASLPLKTTIGDILSSLSFHGTFSATTNTTLFTAEKVVEQTPRSPFNVPCLFLKITAIAVQHCFWVGGGGGGRAERTS